MSRAKRGSEFHEMKQKRQRKNVNSIACKKVQIPFKYQIEAGYKAEPIKLLWLTEVERLCPIQYPKRKVSHGSNSKTDDLLLEIIHDSFNY